MSISVGTGDQSVTCSAGVEFHHINSTEVLNLLEK